MSTIRVLLADDHRILREGIRALIEDQEEQIRGLAKDPGPA